MVKRNPERELENLWYNPPPHTHTQHSFELKKRLKKSLVLRDKDSRASKFGWAQRIKLPFLLRGQKEASAGSAPALLCDRKALLWREETQCLNASRRTEIDWLIRVRPYWPKGEKTQLIKDKLTFKIIKTRRRQVLSHQARDQRHFPPLLARTTHSY